MLWLLRPRHHRVFHGDGHLFNHVVAARLHRIHKRALFPFAGILYSCTGARSSIHFGAYSVWIGFSDLRGAIDTFRTSDLRTITPPPPKFLDGITCSI